MLNNWLKVALYTFIAIIIGSFLLGLVSPGGGMTVNSAGQWNMPAAYVQGQLPQTEGAMYGGMGMHRMGMRGGMGMHGRR